MIPLSTRKVKSFRMIRDLRSEHKEIKVHRHKQIMKEKNMTNNESIIIYKEKFIPANLPTNNLIKDLIEKYNLQNNESTKIALGSFMAYGLNKFKVVEGEFDIEILTQLVKFGVIWEYDNEPDTYRLWQPNSILEFRTVTTDNKNPRVKTIYRTTYNDGSHVEIPEDQIVENYMTNQYV